MAEVTPADAAWRDLSSAPVRVVSARIGLAQRLRNLWQRRELLQQLITSDIRIKYKGSSLGLVWSMLSPALLLVTYYVVFSVFLKNGIPNFAIYLFSGLIAWNMFQTSLITATGVIVERAGLVKKVSFPREILPLANVGASVIYFVMQLLVLVIFIAVMGHAPDWSMVWLLPIAFSALLLFSAAVAMVLAALTVYLRDIKHLIEVALLPWFFLTPVVYSYENSIAPALHRHGVSVLYFCNPLTLIVMTFQRVFYVATNVHSTVSGAVIHLLPTWPASTYFEVNIALLAIAAALFVVAEAVFGRLEGNFEAEL